MMTEHEFLSATQQLVAERPELEGSNVHEQLYPALEYIQSNADSLTSYLEPAQLSVCATLDASTPETFIRVVWGEGAEQAELRLFPGKQAHFLVGGEHKEPSIETITEILILLSDTPGGTA